MGRLVHQREFLAFRNEAEHDIVNLKLDMREVKEKLDQLSADFYEFKDRAYGYFDALFGAVKDLKDEQKLMHQAILRLEAIGIEERFNRLERTVAEILARLPAKRKKR